MRIESGFHWSLVAGSALVLSIIAAIGLNQFVIAEAVSQSEVLDSISVQGMEQVQLTSEVLLYGEPRAQQEWQKQREELSSLLMRNEPLLASLPRKFVVRIATYVNDMDTLFKSLAAAKSARGGQRQAAENISLLSSQLFQKATLLQSELRNLKLYSDAELQNVYAVSKVRMLLTFGVFAVLFLLFATAISLAFRKAVLRPLRSLEEAISQVNKGRREQRAQIFADDEIGVICKTFNGLLDLQAEQNEEIRILAYHDALTGLPNRLLVQDRFAQAVAYAERAESKIALLFLDLDNFKNINDSLGHAVGDELIKSVALRMRECVRDTDTISRLGGDEFLVVLPNLADPEAAAPILSKMMSRLVEPFAIDGHDLATSVSVGIAIYPDDGKDFDTLMKKSDTAMYWAKDAGRSTYRYFDEQMNVEAVERLSIGSGLRRALEQGEFVVYYQPQLDLASGAVIGAEALIRWRHPERGLVPPGRFIGIAEDSRLIVPIGEWVLREACRQTMAWQRAGLPEITIAVNMSAVQFKRGDVEQTVIRALKDAGLDPARLELELTESILIQDAENVLAAVRRLKALGVKLSIDDFGTGYSSLSYLKRFDIDKLKVDQSFIRDLDSDPDDVAIVRAIVEMARSLNLTTIAEGVETAGLLEHVRRLNIDEAQGYYFARPLPAEEFAAYLASSRRQPVRQSAPSFS
jgi:diguanylate cyclase (GGDEF)-like protein